MLRFNLDVKYALAACRHTRLRVACLQGAASKGLHALKLAVSWGEADGAEAAC